MGWLSMTRVVLSARAGARRRAHNEHGFTLAELLVVISVLGVLGGVVVAAVGGTGDRGQAAACETDQRVLRAAIEGYKATRGSFPADQNALVSAKLLELPVTSYTYALLGASYTLTASKTCSAATATTSPWAAYVAPTTTTTAPPPPTISGGSDMFVNASQVPQIASQSSVVVNTTGAGATSEAGEPWVGGQSYSTVWFAYTPTRSGSVRVVVSGYTTSANVWIGIYQGSSINALTMHQQDSGRTGGFTATVGLTYRIHVFTQQGSGTTGTVTFSDNAANGDAFVDAIPVGQLAQGQSTPISLNFDGLSTEPGEPWIALSGYASAWLSYTPTREHSVRVSSTGYTKSNTWIGVYQGSAIGSLATYQQLGGRDGGFTAKVGSTNRVQIFTQVGAGFAGTAACPDGQRTYSLHAHNEAETRYRQPRWHGLR